MDGAYSRSDSPMTGSRLWAGADQPALRALGVARMRVGTEGAPVGRREVRAHPFYILSELTRLDAPPAEPLLIVPPISGQFAPLLRDMIVTLLARYRVFVLDWVNARHVPRTAGSFGFEANIAAVHAAIRAMGSGGHVVALCQGGVPALAATARLSEAGDPAVPAALALIAAPVDAMANPTGLVRLLRDRPISWYRTVPLWPVSHRYAGAGRMVYPAWMQLAAVNSYIGRRATGDAEIARKMRHDDGTDPGHFPFLDLCTSVMDIDGENYVENIARVFHERALARGRLLFEGAPVRPDAMSGTALMTVEGEVDDIAAPGQTAAAHALCPALPARRRGRLVVADCGHFSLFHGARWRDEIAPALIDFVRNAA
ncbi:poly(3-hydroxybutyrate) depolymerase [Rhodovulum iodosum]|uniref:Poly(3-hydroxybutyrate) depolymerase n=1 Tax=Rhodovulum iodosum TaxID=68291 RepID=A0ABV3XX59_9RHOB|nr:polyhydroxyalkanoate depolymerase [Rhodovulum robiginosum]RSK34206.1 polyhydroxyalkanoate depolymerase [Rhodovulum robiginosum]